MTDAFSPTTSPTIAPKAFPTNSSTQTTMTTGALTGVVVGGTLGFAILLCACVSYYKHLFAQSQPPVQGPSPAYEPSKTTSAIMLPPAALAGLQQAGSLSLHDGSLSGTLPTMSQGTALDIDGQDSFI